MRYLLILILFSLSACASVDKMSSLNFITAMNLKIGSTSEKDATEKIGMAGVRSEKNGYYTIDYDDPKTGYQRLSLNFDSETQILKSILWIPTEGEKELTLLGAQEHFKNAHFVQVKESTSNSHSVSSMLVYIDEQKGISIRYNPNSQAVEALAKYDPSARTPANSKKK